MTTVIAFMLRGTDLASHWTPDSTSVAFLDMQIHAGSGEEADLSTDISAPEKGF
ncbi:hypothetical protein CCACVL1_19088 [Corchorus capsularis]|uniref:Uncharacterized protein n=1 Tax=Corchorus capsularis TaxID=210143 RepID=A0A1R3HIH6_COCAP|nr:hypothetical protein CCACVL1_19088 [Corchorus capsularis]